MTREIKAQMRAYWNAGQKMQAFTLFFCQHAGWKAHCHKLGKYEAEIGAAENPALFQRIVKELFREAN